MGRDEGRLLGLDKGFEIGYEMGVYLGCITMLHASCAAGEWKHSKRARHIDALYEHMRTHGIERMDPRKEELQEYVNEIRSKFKVIMALLDDDGDDERIKQNLVQGTGIVLDLMGHHHHHVDHAW